MSGIIFPGGGTQRIPVDMINSDDLAFAGLWEVYQTTPDGRKVHVVFEAPRGADNILILMIGEILMRLKLEPDWMPDPEMLDLQWQPLKEAP